MVRRVILDTNLLMNIPQFHIDIEKELLTSFEGRSEPVLLSPVLEELKAIASSQRVKDSKMALLALEIVKDLPVEDVHREAGETVDYLILRIAKAKGWAVATNDRGLRRKLRDNSIPTIYLRQQSFLKKQ